MGDAAGVNFAGTSRCRGMFIVKWSFTMGCKAGWFVYHGFRGCYYGYNMVVGTGWFTMVLGVEGWWL